MYNPLAKTILLVASLSILCSCASISMVDSWRNPEIRPQRLQKLLVVKIAKLKENRRIFEDVLVAELKQKGVSAVPGYQQITGSDSDRSRLEAAVRNSGSDGVITIQTVNLEHQTQIDPGFATSYPDTWGPGWGPSVHSGFGPSAYSSLDLYGYYGSTTYYQPPSVSSYTVATIQVNLFDARGGKLLWAATTETTEPENTLSVSKDLANIIVKALVKEGLI